MDTRTRFWPRSKDELQQGKGRPICKWEAPAKLQISLSLSLRIGPNLVGEKCKLWLCWTTVCWRWRRKAKKREREREKVARLGGGGATNKQKELERNKENAKVAQKESTLPAFQCSAVRVCSLARLVHAELLIANCKLQTANCKLDRNSARVAETKLGRAVSIWP